MIIKTTSAFAMVCLWEWGLSKFIEKVKIAKREGVRPDLRDSGDVFIIQRKACGCFEELKTKVCDLECQK